MLDAKREKWGEDLMYCIIMYNDPWGLHIGLIDTSVYSHRQYGTKQTRSHYTSYVQHHIHIIDLSSPS